jgi:transposase-like protein
MTETNEVANGHAMQDGQDGQDEPASQDVQAPAGRRKRQAAYAPRFRPELMDELLAGYEKPSDLLGEGGVLKELTKALLERALGAELSHHLGYEKGTGKEQKRENTRNGLSRKRVITDNGVVELAIPRDREGSFEPQIVPKGERRLAGFDERVLALYARGLTVREIQAFVREQYGVDVSPDLISSVTDSVLDEVQQWQNRPLAALYPLVFFDALFVSIRDEGLVRKKAVYLALGVRTDGTREILGVWIEQTEGARFWLRVMNELLGRGVRDIFIAVVDGLRGFPEAINTVFPQTQVQTCIVHLIRNSLAYVAWKEYKAVSHALKAIYQAENADAAQRQLEAFAQGEWGGKYPTIAALWRRRWQEVIPFLAFPAEVRRMIYTTNALESVHSRLRKVIKTRGHFPNDEAATKLLYLALRNITAKWTKPPMAWRAAMNQFAILYGERLHAYPA